MSDADEPISDPEDAEQEPVRDVVRVDGPSDGAEAEDGPEDDDGADDAPPVGREGVLDPGELDIRGRDGVDETDDGRYIISTGGAVHEGSRGGVRDDAGPDTADADAERRDHDTDGPGPTDSSLSTAAGGDSAGDPLEAVADELGALSSSHGFALAVAAGGETDTLRVASGDPTDTLATALRWYARRVNPGEPTDETVTALLAASDLDVG